MLAAAAETKGLITVEEHSIIGGLGSAVAELTSGLNRSCQTDGVNDRVWFPGKEEDLFAYFWLTANHIVNEAKKL